MLSVYNFPFLAHKKSSDASMKLENGSRVAVIGGGPAGSFFSYFLLDLAERLGVELRVDIYEPRDFSLPAPLGCNMCAGVISETLVQNLAMEGINLPPWVVQKSIGSYALHTDIGTQRLDSASHEKRIGAIFRGRGPRGIQEFKFHGLDDYLLSLANNRGANLIRSRVTNVKRDNDRPRLTTRDGIEEEYDLLVVAAGVNTAALKLFEHQDWQYHPPKTTRTAIREYYLGKDVVEEYFADSIQVFLLDIPKLDFAMIIPKGEYASVCLLGRNIDDGLLHTFFATPEVKSCFPQGWRWDQPGCQCSPHINVRAAIRPYSDRVVFIGDSGVSRLYKDGIGSAYRTAKTAASCAILEGISSEDFRRFYAPFCRKIEADNYFGRGMFFITHIIQRVRFFRNAMMHMVAAEQLSEVVPHDMSNVLWDVFTGSAPYRDVFLRTLHPALISRFMWHIVVSVIGS